MNVIEKIKAKYGYYTPPEGVRVFPESEETYVEVSTYYAGNEMWKAEILLSLSPSDLQQILTREDSLSLLRYLCSRGILDIHKIPDEVAELLESRL